MAVFSDLLKILFETERAPRPEIPKALLREGTPPLEVAWRCWGYAERSARRAETNDALSWARLAEKTLASHPDELCAAEVNATRAEVMWLMSEPRAALGPSESAWQTFRSITWDSRQRLVESVWAMLRAFYPTRPPEGTDDGLLLAWWDDRFAPRFEQVPVTLMALHGALGAPAAANRVADEYLEYAEANIPEDHPQAEVRGLARARIGLGRVAAESDPERMYQITQQTLASLDEVPVDSRHHPESLVIRGMHQANAGTALSKLGRLAEARKAYETALPLLEGASEEEELGVRQGLAYLRYREGHLNGLAGEVEALMQRFERLLPRAAQHSNGLIRQNLDRLYRLNLKLSARSVDTTEPTEVLRFLHETLSLKVRNGRASRAVNSLQIAALFDRIDRRGNTGLLIVEQIGGDALLFISYRSGEGPWNLRVHVEVLEAYEPFLDLLAQHRLVLQRIAAGAMPFDSVPSAIFRSACRDAWEMIPAPIQQDIAGVPLLFVTADNQKLAGEIPLELLHDGSEYLGLRTHVLWAPSIGEVMQALGENWFNAVPTGTALLVRAEDDLKTADQEASSAVEALASLEKKVVRRLAPDGETLLADLAEGVDVFHYIGHGFTDGVSDVLALGPKKGVHAVSIPSIAPVPAPLVILNTCLAGKSRQLLSGEERGFAAAFLQQGAPAALGSKYFLPDSIAANFGSLFYGFLRKCTVEHAMRRARTSLAKQGWHPSIWGAFVLFGSPGVDARRPHRRTATTWTAAVTRFIATGDEQHRRVADAGIAADPRLTVEQRAALLSDLDAFAAGRNDYFTLEKLDGPAVTSNLGEAFLTERVLRATGALRYSDWFDEDLKRAVTIKAIELSLHAQSILGDSYLLVATAAEIFRRQGCVDSGVAGYVREANRRLRWLTADSEALSEAASSLDEAIRWLDGRAEVDSGKASHDR